MKDDYMSPDDLIDKYGYFGQRYKADPQTWPAFWRLSEDGKLSPQWRESKPSFPWVIPVIAFVLCLIL